MITYPFGKTPEPGELIEVAPAVYWLRMPLPMSLNHINLYLLESGTGWTIIDTGIRGPETRSLWQQIARDTGCQVVSSALGKPSGEVSQGPSALVPDR